MEKQLIASYSYEYNDGDQMWDDVTNFYSVLDGDNVNFTKETENGYYPDREPNISSVSYEEIEKEMEEIREKAKKRSESTDHYDKRSGYSVDKELVSKDEIYGKDFFDTTEMEYEDALFKEVEEIPAEVQEKIEEYKNYEKESLLKADDKKDLLMDSDIQDFILACNENNFSEIKDVMQTVCDTLDGYKKELDESQKQVAALTDVVKNMGDGNAELVNEIKKLRESNEKLTNEVSLLKEEKEEDKTSLLDTARKNVSLARDMVKTFAKNTVENFKKVGIVAFDGLLTSLPIKGMLYSLEYDAKGLQNHSEKMAEKFDAFKVKAVERLDNAKKALEVLKGNKVDFDEKEVNVTSKLGDFFRAESKLFERIANHFEKNTKALENVTDKAMNYAPEKWAEVRLSRLNLRKEIQEGFGINTEKTGLNATIDNVKAHVSDENVDATDRPIKKRRGR